jgi:type VI secretion system protein VasG
MLNVSLRPLIQRLSPYCRRALGDAAEACIERGNYEISIEHLMVAFLDEPNHDVQTILRHFDIDVDRVIGSIHRQLEQGKTGHTDRPVYSEFLIKWFQEAWLLGSVEFGHGEVRSGMLLLALTLNLQLLAQLDAADELDAISAERLRSSLEDILAGSAEPVPGIVKIDTGDAAAGGIAEGSALSLYAQDLTARAREGNIDPIFCRDREIRQMLDILGRRRKNNPLAVGEAGVGKTALVEGLAIRIASGDVPENMKDVSLLALDLQAMQAGASVRGEFEKRLKSVIEEVKSSERPVVLFIDEVHTLIGAGGAAGTGDAANILKPALARGELPPRWHVVFISLRWPNRRPTRRRSSCADCASSTRNPTASTYATMPWSRPRRCRRVTFPAGSFRIRQ